ncbi:FeoB small GTPase domain-containing protein [Candidatus Borrarchaeum sp.]|uniref:FeoB small GTPase domain-containing protein n=1 Tax=Candidatus Borrarchaeum sp. TaxID=2846742 RepID=UPI00257D69EC|nr:FeoB small GTPase domain-containing protein [Candidatus Borrarchaeum sp.]
MKEIVVALEGNPNTGKSTVFNNLTGARQKVGNWPGKTVEKKEGICNYGDYRIKFVDLPGTYSLSAYTIEEVIARNFIIEEKPDVVVDIVDATNLERNLYLAIQTIELGAKIVIALNLMDQAKKSGYKIDVKELSQQLGCPVVPTVATKKEGMEKLLETIANVASGKIRMNYRNIDYGRDVESKISELEILIEKHNSGLKQKYSIRWLAVALLEEDPDVLKTVFGIGGEEE